MELTVSPQMANSCKFVLPKMSAPACFSLRVIQASSGKTKSAKLIEPPVWRNPGLKEKTEEIPFADENYFFREPKSIFLKKGWNEVVLKVPHGGTSWKWMFTFVPVKIENGQVKEVDELKFSVDK